MKEQADNCENEWEILNELYLLSFICSDTSLFPALMKQTV